MDARVTADNSALAVGLLCLGLCVGSKAVTESLVADEAEHSRVVVLQSWGAVVGLAGAGVVQGRLYIDQSSCPKYSNCINGGNYYLLHRRCCRPRHRRRECHRSSVERYTSWLWSNGVRKTTSQKSRLMRKKEDLPRRVWLTSPMTEVITLWLNEVFGD